MTKTITLTDLKVKKMLIDYEKQVVRVTFEMVDSNQVGWETHIANFWVTMPDVPTQYDFQLPSSYFPTLISLRDDADTTLTSAFLV